MISEQEIVETDAVAELLAQTEVPPQGKNGMDNRSRLRLAQIAKRIGVPDKEIVRLFSQQPNFNERVCAANVRSINLSLPPPNCKKIAENLGFCDGRCPAITRAKSGTPIALLNSKEEASDV